MKELSQVHTRIKSYNPDINMKISFKNKERFGYRNALLVLEFSISGGRSGEQDN